MAGLRLVRALWPASDAGLPALSWVQALTPQQPQLLRPFNLSFVSQPGAVEETVKTGVFRSATAVDTLKRSSRIPLPALRHTYAHCTYGAMLQLAPLWPSSTWRAPLRPVSSGSSLVMHATRWTFLDTCIAESQLHINPAEHEAVTW